MTTWLLWTALGGVAFAQDEVAADTATASDTGGVEVLVEEEELIADFGRLGDQRFAALAAEKRENARKAADARRVKKIKDQTAKALAVVALLLLWLLTRKQNEHRSRVPKRHAPITAEALGGLLFQAVLAADLETYRALHLTGGEAARLLGQGEAERYLARRNVQALEDALVELAIRVPAGATLESASQSAGQLVLRITFDGRTEQVAAGSVRQVEDVWRLYEPPSEREPPSFSGSNA